MNCDSTAISAAYWGSCRPSRCALPRERRRPRWRPLRSGFRRARFRERSARTRRFVGRALRVSAQWQNSAARPAHVPEQQLNNGGGADVLSTGGVLRPTDRVAERRGPLAPGVPPRRIAASCRLRSARIRRDKANPRGRWDSAVSAAGALRRPTDRGRIHSPAPRRLCGKVRSLWSAPPSAVFAERV